MDSSSHICRRHRLPSAGTHLPEGYFELKDHHTVTPKNCDEMSVIFLILTNTKNERDEIGF